MGYVEFTIEALIITYAILGGSLLYLYYNIPPKAYSNY